jgi:hypothetical protein
MPTIKLTITIPADLRRMLQDRADREGRSLSNYVSFKLRQFVTNQNMYQEEG